jgi:hypothetical protein
MFIGIGCGRLGAAEMNRVLVARNHGIDWRILPRTQTFEAELIFVIGESGGKVRGEELRRDLTDHESSLVQIHGGGLRMEPEVRLVKRRQWNAAVRAAVGESRGNGEGAIRKVRARLPSRSAAINLRNFHGLSSGSKRIFACAAFHCGKSSSTSALLSRLSQKRIGPMLRC